MASWMVSPKKKDKKPKGKGQRKGGTKGGGGIPPFLWGGVLVLVVVIVGVIALWSREAPPSTVGLLAAATATPFNVMDANATRLAQTGQAPTSAALLPTQPMPTSPPVTLVAQVTSPPPPTTAADEQRVPTPAPPAQCSGGAPDLALLAAANTLAENTATYRFNFSTLLDVFVDGESASLNLYGGGQMNLDFNRLQFQIEATGEFEQQGQQTVFTFEIRFIGNELFFKIDVPQANMRVEWQRVSLDALLRSTDLMDLGLPIGGEDGGLLNIPEGLEDQLTGILELMNFDRYVDTTSTVDTAKGVTTYCSNVRLLDFFRSQEFAAGLSVLLMVMPDALPIQSGQVQQFPDDLAALVPNLSLVTQQEVTQADNRISRQRFDLTANLSEQIFQVPIIVRVSAQMAFDSHGQRVTVEVPPNATTLTDLNDLSPLIGSP